MDEESWIAQLLEELIAWTRFANRQALLETLNQVLSDDRHLRAFELTDGAHSQTEIAAEVGIGQSTVSGLWQKWRRLGLARDQGNKVVHLVHPADIGMERTAKARSRQSSEPGGPSDSAKQAGELNSS